MIHCGSASGLDTLVQRALAIDEASARRVSINVQTRLHCVSVSPNPEATIRLLFAPAADLAQS